MKNLNYLFILGSIVVTYQAGADEQFFYCPQKIVCQSMDLLECRLVPDPQAATLLPIKVKDLESVGEFNPGEFHFVSATAVAATVDKKGKNGCNYRQQDFGPVILTLTDTTANIAQANTGAWDKKSPSKCGSVLAQMCPFKKWSP